MSGTNGHITAPPNPFDGLSNPNAERGILGCITQDSRMVMPQLEKAGVIAPWFYDLRHSRWFSLFREMHHAEEVVDNVTVAGRLKRIRRPDELGGLEYFADLQANATSAFNWSYYIPDLKGLFGRRKTIEAACRVIDISRDLQSPFESAVGELSNAIESLGGNSNALPDIRDTHDLCANAMSDPPELVNSLLHKGTKFAIGGGSKTCKTWVLLHLNLAVSYGVPWFGFNTVPGPTLFLNLEIHENFFRRRIVRVAEKMGINLKPGMMDVWNLRGYSAPFEELIPRIEKAVRSRGYVLITLDPIYKIYGDLDENKAGDISRLMNELERLAFRSTAALAFAAHFSKGNQSQKDAIDRISGSGVFARDPDTILTMTVHQEKDAFTVDASLRNLPPIMPFVVKWNYPMMERDGGLDPANLKNPKVKSSASGKGERDIILKLVPATGHILKDVLLSRTQAKGIGLNRCRGILAELVEEHRVFEWNIQRPQNRPKPAYSLEPQPVVTPGSVLI